MENGFVKDYSDLDFSLTVHPSFGDIVPFKGYKAIRQSVRNLILMPRYSRPFQPTLASGILEHHFGFNDIITKVTIVEEIKRILSLHEPRITEVEVDIQQVSTSMTINISYFIVAVSKSDNISIEIKKLA